MVKRRKRPFILFFSAVVMALAVVRWAFPSVAATVARDTDVASEADTTAFACALADTRARPHRIKSVPNYATAFPDINDVQLQGARRWGVRPVQSREDAARQMDRMVYIGGSPYYSLDRFTSSVPYLVPRAAHLLDDIGRAYFDSLYVKGIPLHRFVVSSVLRSHDDVQQLQRTNGNATSHSCHLYATTFDISYISFATVEDPDGPARRQVTDDTLKYVLSEVLRDFRQQDRCYVKYEVKQSCFHITVK